MTDIPETHETGPKIAAQIAEATKPYLRIAEVAREVGKIGIATEMEARANTIALRLERIASTSIGRRSGREAALALSLLFDETEGNSVLTEGDFRRNFGEVGQQAWTTLRTMATLEGDEVPFSFVEYHTGKFAMVGDVAATAALVKANPELSGMLSSLNTMLQAAIDA